MRDVLFRDLSLQFVPGNLLGHAIGWSYVPADGSCMLICPDEEHNDRKKGLSESTSGVEDFEASLICENYGLWTGKTHEAHVWER